MARPGLSSSPSAERISVLGLRPPRPPRPRQVPSSLKLAPYFRGSNRRLLDSSDPLDDGREPRRDETMWGAVASRKSSGNNRRRNLAAVPKSLPGAARVNNKRFPRQFRSGRASAGSCAFSGGAAIGFTVSVAAASRSTCREPSIDRSRVGAGSSVSLLGLDGRLGQ